MSIVIYDTNPIFKLDHLVSSSHLIRTISFKFCSDLKRSYHTIEWSQLSDVVGEMSQHKTLIMITWVNQNRLLKYTVSLG